MLLIVLNSNFSEQTDYFAENSDMGDNNWLHRIILRLKAKMSVFLILTFNGCVIIDKSHDNFAVVGDRLLSDNDIIIV